MPRVLIVSFTDFGWPCDIAFIYVNITLYTVVEV